jgi:hypothetical protein
MYHLQLTLSNSRGTASKKATTIWFFTEKFNVLDFWRSNSEFPTIKKIAQRVLAIPASEITEERVFSGAGYVMNPKRTLLDPENLQDIVFIHENFELKSK